MKTIEVYTNKIKSCVWNKFRVNFFLPLKPQIKQWVSLMFQTEHHLLKVVTWRNNGYRPYDFSCLKPVKLHFIVCKRQKMHITRKWHLSVTWVSTGVVKPHMLSNQMHDTYLHGVHLATITRAMLLIQFLQFLVLF